MPCYAMLGHAMLYYTILCNAMMCYEILYYATIYCSTFFSYFVILFSFALSIFLFYLSCFFLLVHYHAKPLLFGVLICLSHAHILTFSSYLEPYLWPLPYPLPYSSISPFLLSIYFSSFPLLRSLNTPIKKSLHPFNDPSPLINTHHHSTFTNH